VRDARVLSRPLPVKEGEQVALGGLDVRPNLHRVLAPVEGAVLVGAVTHCLGDGDDGARRDEGERRFLGAD
jgi:hypothetical protein